MTTIRLALGELRRVTAGRVPLLVTIALILVPLIYGSMYLVSNSDPQHKVNELPAALVVDDSGAQSSGGQVNIGQDVASTLQEEQGFNWTQTDADEAQQGLRSGKYSFSLTLPKEFSAALATPQHDNERSGLLQLTTSNADNYLAAPITDSVGQAVRDAVAKSAGPEASNRLQLAFSSAGGRLADAGDTAKQLADSASKARDGAVRDSNDVGKLNAKNQELSKQAKQVGDGMDELTNGLNDARDQANQLPPQTTKLAADARKLAESAQGGGGAPSGDRMDKLGSDVQGELRGKVSDDELGKVLDMINAAKTGGGEPGGGSGSFAQDAQRVSVEAAKLSSATPDVAKSVSDGATGVGMLVGPAGQSRDNAKQAADMSSKLVGGSTELRNNVGGLAGSASQLQQQLTSAPAGKDQDKSQSPVGVSSEGTAKASTYGDSLAPFFLAVAMWIGAFALFLLLRPLSSRALAARAPVLGTALGGWLPAAALAVVQAVLVYFTVMLAIGVTPSAPVLAGLFLILVGLSFTALLHGLGALFGNTGKVIGLALLVLQLFTTGGAYPAQSLPSVLRALHTVLPMGHATDGLRQLYYGGNLGSSLAVNVGVLVLWGLFGLILGMIAARTKRMWTPDRIRPELAT